MHYYLVTFVSTHAALAFEHAFGSAGRLVPVPPAIRAGCGMGLRFSAFDVSSALEKVQDLAQKEQLIQALDGVYLCDKQGFHRIDADNGAHLFNDPNQRR